MIKAVIFDIDNTLYSFDQVNGYGMRAVLDYCGTWSDLGEAELMELYQKAWHMAQQRIGTDTAAIHNRMLRFQCMMELMGQPLFPHVRTLYHLYWDTLLDHMEPSEGIVTFIQTLKERGKTIIVSTHIFSLIERVCDRVGIIINGKMIMCDTLENIKAGQSLEDRFFDIYKETVGEEV